MSQRFAVVHEANADHQIATELADRVLMDAIEWVDDDLIARQRTWVTEDTGGRRLTWKAIPKLARSAGIRAYGHFDGEPGLPDAAAARRAIQYLLAAVPKLEAILLIRDQDDQPERRAGLEQARAQDRSGVLIVIGVAVVERECWVISGFEPMDDDELARLKSERVALGFDPRLSSHELIACKNDTATRSPKRVLRQLSSNDWHRERRCWADAPLETLRERGSGNGLAGYLHEIRVRLAPLLGHVSQD